jgi:hypothetical protein
MEAGIPGRWEFTALFRLRFGGVGWSAVRRSLGQRLHLLVEIVLREAKTFQRIIGRAVDEGKRREILDR